jgi:hypothetical protein
VLVQFPFSDLSQTKLRPAVVLADVGRADYILCQVTSKRYGDPSAIELDIAAFASGSVRVTSFDRPTKLFTAKSEPDHIASRQSQARRASPSHSSSSQFSMRGRCYEVHGPNPPFQPTAKSGPRLNGNTFGSDRNPHSTRP